jgi:hypothetical protein
LSDSGANERRGKGFAGLDSMVSDVSEDVGRTADSVESASIPTKTEAVSPAAERAERPSASIPTNPPSAGSGGAGWIFGGIFLLFVLAAIVGSSGNTTPAPSSTSSWESPPAAFPTPVPAPAPVAAAPAVAPSNAVEKPPVGTDRLLDSAQIRYCLTEKIRIQAIESVVNADREAEIVNFNALVGDYNSRCGQFRYRQDELDRVQSEIEPKSDELVQAAKTKWVRNALGLDAGGETGKAAIANAEAPKKPAIPKNSHLDYLGHDWECNRGYRKAGNECAAIILPQNAKLDYLGNDWECNHGFRRNGTGCDPVRVPKNGRLDFLGNDWECDRGFRRQADECSAVQVPANAKLDFLGNDWECERGFRKNWNECVPL